MGHIGYRHVDTSMSDILCCILYNVRSRKTMGSDASVLFRVQHLSDGPRRALKKYEAGPE